MPNAGNIISGREYRNIRVNLAPLYKKLDTILVALRAQSGTTSASPFLNPRCDNCEYAEACKATAIAVDHLSLLRGMSRQEILRHNSKGIFTVNQLSYTFHARRPRKRAKNPASPHHFALQALSLREKKIHVHGAPDIPCGQPNIYFDVEGLPNSAYYYLIGALVVTNTAAIHHHFWANDTADQDTIFTEFASLVGQYPECRLFHYGSYDVAAIRTAIGRMSNGVQEQLKAVTQASTNVLTLVYKHIYFPTYSNGLKDVAAILGFKWTDKDPTAMRSVLWRETWEQEHDPGLKAKLVQYNMDDCSALRLLCDFVLARKSSGIFLTFRFKPPKRKTVPIFILQMD